MKERIIEINGTYYCEYRSIFGNWKRYQTGCGFTDGDVIFHNLDDAIAWIGGDLNEITKVVWSNYDCWRIKNEF